MVHQLLDYFLKLDTHLNAAAQSMGPWLYVLLFAIVFCETGLVVTPFLPGDSLLFALGALAVSRVSDSGDMIQAPAVKLQYIIPLLVIAANCGDLLNYTIGYHLGPRVFRKDQSFLLNRKHLLEAQDFYNRHGRKTIIIARFVPIIRTFAPFVAGIGKMSFARFAAFSIAGGIFWVVSVTLCGYYFGNVPWVKSHFQVVVLAIIVISLIPPMIHAMGRRGKPVVTAAPDGSVK